MFKPNTELKNTKIVVFVIEWFIHNLLKCMKKMQRKKNVWIVYISLKIIQKRDLREGPHNPRVCPPRSTVSQSGPLQRWSRSCPRRRWSTSRCQDPWGTSCFSALLQREPSPSPWCTCNDRIKHLLLPLLPLLVPPADVAADGATLLPPVLPQTGVTQSESCCKLPELERDWLSVEASESMSAYNLVTEVVVLVVVRTVWAVSGRPGGVEDEERSSRQSSGILETGSVTSTPS